MIRRLHPVPLLFIICLLASSAHAGERRARAQPDISDAHAVGRGLVSPDPKVRAVATTHLRKAITSGRATDAYLAAMANASASWSNNLERLTEFWIERAVEGDARERGVAARLLHALGPDAVARLAHTLRRLRHGPRHPHLNAVGPTQTATPDGSEQAATPAAPTSPSSTGLATPPLPAVAPQLMQIYRVKPLMNQGLSGFTIRNLLRKTANASEVTAQLDGRYVVVADAKGHAAIAALLRHAVRPPPVPQPQAPGTEAPLRVGKPASGYGPAGGAIKNPAEVPAEPDGKFPSIVKTEDSISEAKWRLHAAVLQVPRAEASMIYGKTMPEGGVLVRRGSPRQAADWLAQIRKLPDARQIAVMKPQALASNQASTIAAGEPYRYTKGVRQSKDGAYHHVRATLHQGYRITFRITETDAGGVLDVEAIRSSIARPIPKRTVKPIKGSTITIEEPQWSSARSEARTAADQLPMSTLFIFQGLDEQQPHDDLVMIVGVTSAK